MQTALLRPKQTALKAAISKSHMYDLIAKGKFPKPIKISDRITAFLESEVDAWIKEQIETKRSEEA